MRKLEVLVEENAHGSVRPVEVMANAPISMLVPALVEELQLPQTDLFGKRLVYVLRHASGGRILPENATLLASGVKDGAQLALDSYVLDGSMQAGMYNTSQSSIDDVFHTSQTLADSDKLPVIKQTSSLHSSSAEVEERKWTRRSFLLIGGVTLGAGTLGLGYAAYRSLQGTAKPLATMSMQTVVTPQKTPPMKATIPTTAKPALVFTGHQQLVRAVSWSPDGTMLASGADDTQLFLWGTDGTISQTIAHPASVHAIAWSPNGQRLVTGANTQVLFLDVPTGAILSRSTHRHIAPVSSLAWAAHNPQQVVSGGLDMRAIVWNTTNYHAQFTFTHHDTPIEAVSWAANGKTIASSSHGGAVRVWNAGDGQEVHGYYLDAKIPMRALAFAPTGRTLAAGGDDGVVRLWNGLTCQQQVAANDGQVCTDVPKRLQLSHTAIRSIAWSPDGRFLAAGSDNGTLALWYPARSQKPLFTLTIQQNTPVHSITWSPKSDQLATAAGNRVTLWNLM